jgi:hypothetical protein
MTLGTEPQSTTYHVPLYCIIILMNFNLYLLYKMSSLLEHVLVFHMM